MVHRGVESPAKEISSASVKGGQPGTPGNSLRDAKNLEDSNTKKEEEKRWT